MNAPLEFSADEIRAIAAKRHLTQLDLDTARMILSGRTMFPLASFSPRVREFVTSLQDAGEKCSSDQP
jgi:hypothetical protein